VVIYLIDKLRNFFEINSEEARLTKVPAIIGIVFVYLVTLVLQFTYNITLRSFVEFTTLICLHLFLYLHSEKIFKHKQCIYFGIQGVIIYYITVIMPKGYETIILGLIPILLFQSILAYNTQVIKNILTHFFYYFVFSMTILEYNSPKDIIKYIPALFVTSSFVRVYYSLFLNQVRTRIQSQKLLKELELAYEKVEDLTLSDERQRMARDLHDTLSQGLSGLIMQLDAVNANLDKNNIKRAQEIVQKSMEHARRTLADSRQVIDDLRLKSNSKMDFTKSIENEIEKINTTSNIAITYVIKVESDLPLKIFKHSIYIIREALNNIDKHSKAKTASLEIVENQQEICINIKDDGIGFDTKILEQQFGHYGILGMTERVEAIGGKITISSKKKAGTNINILIPIKRGISGEDE
jgi:Signal transduction histidine kinase